jgi:exopolysaccharide biosynthesis polyprenyl glycosylphosphotransferase
MKIDGAGLKKHTGRGCELVSIFGIVGHEDTGGEQVTVRSALVDDVGIARRSKPSQDWSRSLKRRLAITDFLVVTWVVVGTQIARFRGFDSPIVIRDSIQPSGLNYSELSAVLGVAWLISLVLFQTRDARIIGTGNVEYRRIVDATLRLFGLVAIAAFLFQLDLARAYIIIALPVGLLALLSSRWIWRKWLATTRSRGGYSSRVLLVGSRASVEAIGRELVRTPAAGYTVVGACIPGDIGGYLFDDGTIPVSSHLDYLHAAIEATAADTVVITSSDELPPDRIRELSWSLEPGRQHLVLAPSLTDIGGPRIHMRPVAGLPLIHVEIPQYEGLKRFSKRAFDLAASAVIIAILSPVLLAVAIAVKLGSEGPVLFRQERVGLSGNPFKMLKFRSMVADAEMQLAALQFNERAEGNVVMFKMRNDPRITRLGRTLRRFSLDELPQLFNVFVGSMSLVGPRPPLDREVAVYENRAHRRFLVKPGITGPWQVGGRSNLSWEDTVRLDLYYVENWSLTGDLVILFRTARAVFAREGAY